jgi:hypothetical protein
VNADQELRERFAALRRDDAKRTPDFERMLRRSRHRASSRLGGLVAASCLLLAAVAASVFQISHDRARPAPNAFTPSLANWRAPTDFLLNTPGRELMHTVPRIGEPSHWIGQEPHS